MTGVAADVKTRFATSIDDLVRTLRQIEEEDLSGDKWEPFVQEDPTAAAQMKDLFETMQLWLEDHTRSLPIDDELTLLDMATDVDGWNLALSGLIFGTVHSYTRSGTRWDDEKYTRTRQAMVDRQLITATFRDALQARRAAQEAATRATASATAAKTSAGMTGDATLAKEFSEYAKSELRRSMWFRIVAYLLLAGSLGFVTLGPHPESTVSSVLEGELVRLDLAPVIYRAVVAALLAGAAAFVARLGGQHRRLGNWSKSIAVQLKSFEAFTSTIEDRAVRDKVQQEFARRVLGAPPEATVGKGDDSMSVSLAEIVSLLSRAPGNSTP